jgi:hypothetical protein
MPGFAPAFLKAAYPSRALLESRHAPLGGS